MQITKKFKIITMLRGDNVIIYTLICTYLQLNMYIFFNYTRKNLIIINVIFDIYNIDYTVAVSSVSNSIVICRV